MVANDRAVADAMRHLGSGIADDGGDGPIERGAHRLYATDDLALEALLVEKALARDDEIGRNDAIVQVEFVGHQVEPGHELAPECHEPTGEAAGGPGTRHLADIDAELLPVQLHQPLESTAQQL